MESEILNGKEFRAGPFSTGDLIALAGVVFMSGSLWFQVGIMQKEQDRLNVRVQALEQVIPSDYVRRQDYREDIRELKTAVLRIESKLDNKVDR